MKNPTGSPPRSIKQRPVSNLPLRILLPRPSSPIVPGGDPGTWYASKYQRFSDTRTTCGSDDFREEVREMHSRLQPNGSDQEYDFGYLSLTSDCLQCTSDCSVASCPTTELTAQCTDQCFVVPCTDVAHGETGCGTDSQTTCNVGADCSNYEEVMQCCKEFFGEQKQFPMNDLLSLTSPPATANSVHVNYIQESPYDFGRSLPDASHSYNPGCSTFSTNTNLVLPPPEMHPPLFPLPYPIQSSSAPGLETCMWSNCNSTFPSIEDLLGHVNYEHLRPLSHEVPQLCGPSNSHDNTLSCLWADCGLYPSSQSFPGPSSGNDFDASLAFLANHLFHDHLGVPDRLPSPFPSPYCTPSTESSELSIETLTSNSPRIPESSPNPGEQPDHSKCTGSHICLWEECGMNFESCDQLTTHLKNAHVGAGKGSYDCHWKGCDRNGERGFSSKQKICRHLQSHTGHRPFQCDICQQNFSEAATLQQHMRRHTQEKPCVCDYPGCGKAFAITGALTIHKRTHNGHKPFKCTFCDKTFSESSNLSKHLRTHTGARPYVCDEPGCGKSFARPDQRARHMRIHKKKKDSEAEAKAGT